LLQRLYFKILKLNWRFFIKKYTYGNGDFLTYNLVEGYKKPGIIFLAGFKSNKEGIKALELEKLSIEEGFKYIRFDYFGHGESSGRFEDGTISLWLDNVLTIIDNLTDGPQILVGSSMGGWLMLLAAILRPDRIAGLLGIAAAPDFTENLIWNTLNKQEQEHLELKGNHILSDERCTEELYVSRDLIYDGRKHLLLQNNIEIKCPIILLHGMKDVEVPYHTSIRIAELVKSEDVEVQLLKHADHRMNGEKSLCILRHSMKSLALR
jgi:pimeloyl-ACP methyl ester carboxylesterase